MELAIKMACIIAFCSIQPIAIRTSLPCNNRSFAEWKSKRDHEQGNHLPFTQLNPQIRTAWPLEFQAFFAKKMTTALHFSASPPEKINPSLIR
jgi:hypothetical protein